MQTVPNTDHRPKSMMLRWGLLLGLWMGHPLVAAEPPVALDPEAARAEIESIQSEMGVLSRRLVELWRLHPSAEQSVFVDAGSGRPVLGVVPKRSAHGQVELQSVSPGLPAAKAGLQSGDVLIAVNGKDLGRVADDRAAIEALRSALEGVQPEQELKIVYLRDGQRREAKSTVTSVPLRMLRTERTTLGAPDGAKVRELMREALLMERGARLQGGQGPGEVQIESLIIGDGLGAEQRKALEDRIRVLRVPAGADHGAISVMLEATHDAGGAGMFQWQRSGGERLAMVPLEAGLGRYFGTDRGLLVLHADQLELEAGDVLLELNGQAIAQIADLITLLESSEQEQPSAIQATVLRDRQRLQLNLPVESLRAPAGSVIRKRILTR